MKLVKRTAKNFVFLAGKKECALFRKLLKFYPVIEAPYQPLSKLSDAEEIKADQKLLEEAIAAQKQENKKLILKFVKDPDRFKRTSRGYLLKLEPFHLECLLQVLNEIRVGCWRKLGSPDPKNGKPPVLTPETMPFFWAMILSEQFEVVLIQANAA